MAQETTAATLVAQPIGPDARDRLARHLWIADAGSGNGSARLWDARAVDRTAWLAKADALLAVITGTKG